jgi:hypothetical protein
MNAISNTNSVTQEKVLPPRTARTLLPVEPLTQYPIEGLKNALQPEKFDSWPYYLAAGDFDNALSTPPLDYSELEQERLRPGARSENATRSNKLGINVIRILRKRGNRKPERSQQFSRFTSREWSRCLRAGFTPKSSRMEFCDEVN